MRVLPVVLILFLAGESHATTLPCRDGFNASCSDKTPLVASLFAVAATSGLVTGLVNSVFVSRAARAPLAWLITGLISAGLNFAVSTVAVLSWSPYYPNPVPVTVLGIGSALIGGFDVVLAIAGQLFGFSGAVIRF